MKNTIIIGGIVLILLAGGSWWTRSLQGSSSIVSGDGLHWHPTLEIFVKGEKIEIPESIGLGAVHQPMHTHDDLPVIHLEFSGVVHEKDLMLEQFFKNWEKDMNSFGMNMSMTVNGETNTQYGKYVMRDGDKIELRYE